MFVSVVDPGVGTDRRSIVAKTTENQYIITPDNGTLTHIKSDIGIVEARIIDETVNRLPHSGESYTFHGRDVYAYTGARLASGVITFEEVGPEVPVDSVIRAAKIRTASLQNSIITEISIFSIFVSANLWTNIDRDAIHRIKRRIWRFI